MDSFNVITTPKALSLLNDYISYIQYTLMNEQAAKAVWEDAMDTAAELEKVAGSLRPCDDPDLKSLGYRKINFLHHRYVMIYRIDGKNAYVEAIYHQLQDYENIFLEFIS